jgi:hypothetical protein
MLPIPGYIKGCGCALQNRTQVEGNICPAKRWTDDELKRTQDNEANKTVD